MCDCMLLCVSVAECMYVYVCVPRACVFVGVCGYLLMSLCVFV